VVARTTGPAAESVSDDAGVFHSGSVHTPIRSRGRQHAGAGIERARCPMTQAVKAPEEESRPGPYAAEGVLGVVGAWLWLAGRRPQLRLRVVSGRLCCPRAAWDRIQRPIVNGCFAACPEGDGLEAWLHGTGDRVEGGDGSPREMG
jgi:hypothetical protein